MSTVVGAGSLTVSRSDETSSFRCGDLESCFSFRDTGADSGGRRSTFGVLGSQSAESWSPRDASRHIVLLIPRGVHAQVATGREPHAQPQAVHGDGHMDGDGARQFIDEQGLAAHDEPRAIEGLARMAVDG